ncbi:MAG TPA: FG-GAP-like repeat-containing protein [Thermoanaerobaculia bacterium]|jgi:hypothetical protein
MLRAALLLLFPLLAYAAEPVLITNPRLLDTGATAGTQNLAGGDFNRDGRRDFVLFHPDAITVHLGRTDGTFASPVVTPMTYFGNNYAVGDFNGDGFPDVATDATREHEITLLLGRGDGSFNIQGSRVAPQPAGPIGFGDFTGDGHADIITHSVNGPAVTLFPGDGNGSTLPPVVTSLPETLFGRGTIETADFDRDGKLDAVLTAIGATVIARGNGDGTFTRLARLPGGHVTVVADFNADGRPDLATADSSSAHTIIVAINRPDGTFPWQQIPSGIVPEHMAAADMNGDDAADLVLQSSASGELAVLTGRNDGTFATPRLFLGVHATGLEVADYDSDGARDVLSIPYSYESPAWFARGNGDGTLHLPPSYPTRLRGPDEVPFDRFGVRFGDVTGDGKPDVITFADPAAGSTAFELTVLPGLGGASFAPPRHTPTDIHSADVTWVAEDFDGDGMADVVLSDPHANRLRFYGGRADGMFRLPADSPREPHGKLFAADFTGDGRLDVAVVSNASAIVYPGNGTGGFGPPQPQTPGPQTFVADLDGDGKSELVFPPPPGTEAHNAPLGLADVNHDGRPDFLYEISPSTLRVFPGVGDGTFGPYFDRAFEPQFDGQGMLVADVDGDDLDDLLIGRKLLLGNGDAHHLRWAGAGGGNADAADLDGNGTLDFAFETFGGSVGILLTNVEEGLDIPTTISITPSLRAPRYGQEVIYFVRVAAGSPYVMDGLVRLDDGDRILGYATVGSNGYAEIRTAFEQGPHTITATMLRNDVYAAATSTAVQHQVGPGQVALRVAGNRNPSSIQDSFFIEVSLLVEGHSVLAQPTGTLTVFVDGMQIATADASLRGVHLKRSAPIGSHVITVEYSGDANFAPATASYVQVVTPPEATVTLTVTPGEAVVAPGTPLTLTAHVTPATATGTVTFFANHDALLTVPLQNGTATLTVSHLRSGLYGLTARYSGDATVGPAASQPVPLEVGPGLPLRGRPRSVRKGR